MNLSAEYYRASTLTPEWIAYSNEVKQRDNFTCVSCRSKQSPLHAHHKYYVDRRLPWEYPLSALETLCASCHTERHLQKIPKYSEGSLDLLKLENYTLFLREKERDETLKNEIGKKYQAVQQLKQQKSKEHGDFYASVFNKCIIYIFGSSLIIMLLYNYFPPKQTDADAKDQNHFYSYWFISLLVVFVLRRIYRFAKSEFHLWSDKE